MLTREDQGLIRSRTPSDCPGCCLCAVPQSTWRHHGRERDQRRCQASIAQGLESPVPSTRHITCWLSRGACRPAQGPYAGDRRHVGLSVLQRAQVLPEGLLQVVSLPAAAVHSSGRTPTSLTPQLRLRVHICQQEATTTTDLRARTSGISSLSGHLQECLHHLAGERRRSALVVMQIQHTTISPRCTPPATPHIYRQIV